MHLSPRTALRTGAAQRWPVFAHDGDEPHFHAWSAQARGAVADGLTQGGVSTRLSDVGDQIEFEDRSPRIHELFARATRRAGIEVKRASG